MSNIEVGTAYVNVLPSMRGFEAAMNKEIGATDTKPAGEKVGKKLGVAVGETAADKAAAKIKSGIKAAGAAVGAAAAAAVAGAFAVGKQAFGNFANYEQLVGGVDTMFKDASDEMQQYAAQAFKTAGMSGNEYMETVTNFSAALIKSLGGDTAKAADYADMAITDMADNANKFGTELDVIKETYSSLARGNYAMLDNLKLGYAGTKKGLESLLKDAELYKKKQGEVVDYSVDSYADIVEAIHVVQSEMGITGTTAKEASDTITGSVESAKAAWQNWLTGLADPNADMDKLTDDLVTSIETAAKNILPRVGIIAQNIATEGVDLLSDYLSKAIAAFGTDGVAMGEAAWNVLGVILDVVVELGGKLLIALGLLLASMVVSAVNGLGDLAVKAGAAAWSAAGDIISEIKRGFAEGYESKIKPALDVIATGVETVFNGVVDFVSEIPNKIIAFFDGLGKDITDAIGDIDFPTPHISGYEPVAIAGIETPFSLPVVEWYGSGGYFDSAQIVGIGERGPEMALPLIGQRMRPFARAVANELGGGGATYTFGDIYIEARDLDGINAIEQFVELLEDTMGVNPVKRGGLVYG